MKRPLSYTHLLLAILCCLYSGFSNAQQEKKEKVPSYFGVQFKPLIPGDFLGKSKLDLNADQFYATITQKFGYSFGASVRVGLTKLISIETGINQVQRYYNVNFSIPDSGLYQKDDFGIVNYDIPLNVLFYIQLSEKIFMNASLGGSVVYNPSDIATSATPGGLHEFKQEARRLSKVGFEINGNVGFEFRTEKSGIFYLGGSGRIPLKPIFDVASVYEYKNYKKVAIGSLIGTYLSLDIRYYLPNIKNKGTQFMKGPIEQ